MSDSVDTGRDDEARGPQATSAEPPASQEPGAGGTTGPDGEQDQRAAAGPDGDVPPVAEPAPDPAEVPAGEQARPADQASSDEQAQPADQASSDEQAQPADQASSDEQAQPADQASSGEGVPEEPGAASGRSPAPAPSPGPTPGPRPGPGGARPTPSPATVPSPSVPGPASGRPAARAGARRGARGAGPGGARTGAPAVSAEHAPADTAEWGRVAEDGVVHVRTPEGERVVGSYPDVPAEEALAYFGRRFADLVAQLDLVEQRLSVPDAPVGELRSALAKVQHAVTDATAVGDLAVLGTRVDELGGRVTEREREANIAREQARTVVRTQRVALVEEAEALAETDPAQVQWKASGERLRAIFDEWREQQRAAGTARLPKGEEDELWRRLKHARNRFERHRRHHFAELDAQHGEAKTVKEGLIAEAEALSGSTEWGPTSTAYRQLMDRWKAAPRASRKEDDALWARFRAAQDVFFGARDAKDAEQLAGEKENLAVKEQLLVEAEAILPVRDVRAATTALRDVQERWDDAGRVPRADLQRVEKRMRAVEQAVRDADSDRWRRTNPEVRARAEGALGQLQDSISDLEGELETARAAGDERRTRRAQEALDARRAWLEQVERAAVDLRG